MRLVILFALILVSVPAAGFPICPAPPARRSDCVHDGDTWWIGRTKFRHAVIDAPEIGDSAQCAAEIDKGRAARDRLAGVMSDGFHVVTTGEVDRYGRSLATIVLSDGREAGELLVSEGLAGIYGRDNDWCE